MEITVNGVPYAVKKLLGHGKGGYSYLAERDGKQAVVKQIHHEPCDYYAFGDKMAAEERDYARLSAAGILMPRLLDIDRETERILKEYVPGPTVFELVRDDAPADRYIAQVRQMAEKAQAAGLNIDYFPTNFVVRRGLIYYVDYECNDYMAEWNFENWGVKYWRRTPEFEAYLAEHPGDPAITIRQERISPEEYVDFLKRTDLGSQYPRERFQARIEKLVRAVSVSLIARNEQGKVVGVLFGLTDFAYWLYVTDLGVDRAYTRRGIGERLMRAAHEIAGGEKDVAIYLVANENAVPFYEKLGMERAGDVMRYSHVDWTDFTVE